MQLGGLDSNLAALRRSPGVDPAPRVEVRRKAGTSETADPERSGAVRVTLSRDATEALNGGPGATKNDESDVASAARPRGDQPAPGELSEADEEVVRKLKARDTEVRVHEQAHISAGGRYVNGGPSYTYQNGPDGKRYAIGGSVNIDASPVAGDPEATLEKARVVERAALAPKDPSSTDRQVASAARKMAAQARADLAEAKAEERSNTSDTEAVAGDEAESADRPAGDSERPLPPAFDPTSDRPSAGRASARAFERAAVSPIRGQGAAFTGAVDRALTNSDDSAIADRLAASLSQAAGADASAVAGSSDGEGAPRFLFRRAARAYAAAAQ